MPKLFHPQYERLLDRKSGLEFAPQQVGEVWRAVADVPEEAVAEFLERGFQYVDPPAPSEPAKKGK